MQHPEQRGGNGQKYAQQRTSKTGKANKAQAIPS
jgi:hypothetical protein